MQALIHILPFCTLASLGILGVAILLLRAGGERELEEDFVPAKVEKVKGKE